MAQVGRTSVAQVVEMLNAPAGLGFRVAEIAQRDSLAFGVAEAQRIISQNVAAELAERTAGAQYPALYVYCEKISNELREKFRTFSGKVKLSIEVRVSQDRLEAIDQQLGLYAEAITDVLDAKRGDWGQGMFYGGGYEVSFSAAKHGGKNFLQTAKVTFDVEVSVR